MAKPRVLIRTGEDGVRRCWWCGDDPLYVRYHDREWGVPVRDDRRLFEKLCLEGFQSGLSWLTILRKRQRFREVFLDFDFQRVARFDRRRVERLLQDAGIVRHRGKIEAAIHNARRTVELVRDFGSLAAFVWQYEPQGRRKPDPLTPTSSESHAMSKELKARGFTYVGPTTAHAFLQAMGVINDHATGCSVRAEVEARRARFRRPRRR